jgi:cytochrome o ubiquinol oxidase subunit 1
MNILDPQGPVGAAEGTILIDSIAIMLAILGMTRRMQHYDVPEWRPWLIIAAGGAVLITIGIALQIAQLAVSIRRRAELRDETGDPWDGRSLEWATASPPPVFNFAILPLRCRL